MTDGNLAFITTLGGVLSYDEIQEEEDRDVEEESDDVNIGAVHES